ncbi:MAG TPA: regulator, partial [Prolixibacteraceae bacterium]
GWLRFANLSLLFVLFTYHYASAFENANPVVKNYSKTDYNADNQNWSVAEDSAGIIYFANSKGLLEFDGISWKLYPSPNGNILRCVAIDKNNRIYTSGYRELGYWERNAAGTLKYVSLTPLAEKYFTPNIEFWNIITTGKKVYFHSFLQILIWEDGNITPVQLPSFSNSMFIIDDQIIVDLADGLYAIENNHLKPFVTGSFFNQKQIRFVFRDENKKLIIGTASEGIYRYDGFNFKILNPGWNDYFIKNKINRASQSSNGNLVIGTILDGVVAFDQSGKMLFKLNTQNGLQNNTVLGIEIDQNQNIWQALDRGIDFITFPGKSSYSLHPVRGIGAVYTAAIFNNQLYLGTNQGLYYKKQNDPDDKFILMPQTQGQVWNCRIINGKLFIGHNNGTFVLSDSGLKKISDVNGAFAITPDPKMPGFLLQSTYSDIVAIDFSGAEPRWSKNLKNFNDLIQYIEVDFYGNIWVGHMHRGIYRLKLSDKRDAVIKSIYYGENSPFGKDHGIHPFKIEDRIVFTTARKLFTFDELKDTIVEYTDLNNQLGHFAGAHRIFAAPNHYYWFVTNESIALFQIKDNSASLIKVYPSSLFSNQLIENFENITPLSDREALLCMENGYAILNAGQPENESLIKNKNLVLRDFITTDRRGNTDTLPSNQSTYTLRYNRNNPQLKFSLPLFTTDKISFQAFLEGIDPGWRTPVALPVFKFERLPQGIYTLHVKATDPWGAESKTLEIKLIILPPWYLSTWMQVGYPLIILFLLVIFRRRVISQTHLKEKQRREEKEKELIRLRNEKLQDEITYKSQQLADSTMLIIKKNEFLLELKRILKSLKNHLESRFPDKYYADLTKRIDDNIASRDDWKTFETNFERAHEEFITMLKTGYPKLTPSDLRLCAYLRMNLSSKEIAPLLGISVRGLENHRYRLRKKMGLDVDVNLSEFMMSAN